MTVAHCVRLVFFTKFNLFLYLNLFIEDWPKVYISKTFLLVQEVYLGVIFYRYSLFFSEVTYSNFSYLFVVILIAFEIKFWIIWLKATGWNTIWWFRLILSRSPRYLSGLVLKQFRYLQIHLFFIIFYIF
jgi:hypothetical protein